MEDMMTVMRSHENNTNNSNTTSNIPTWKLYENPLYITSHDHHQPHPIRIHTLHLPIPPRKLADLTFLHNPPTEPTTAQLKTELDRQCASRKKAESRSKRLFRELHEERKEREALEGEIVRMREEMEDERKMLRTAEVIREERVQMKLAEARVVLEEKLSELEIMSTCREGSKLRFFVGDKVSVGDSLSTARGVKGFVEFPRVAPAIGCKRNGDV